MLANEWRGREGGYNRTESCAHKGTPSLAEVFAVDKLCAENFRIFNGSRVLSCGYSFICAGEESGTYKL